MDGNSPFLEIAQPCDQAVEWLIQRLGQGGMYVVRTFDLQMARRYQDICRCPYHGTQQCDCQMVVLMVYLAEKEPLSIVAHGHGCQTWFALVDTPQQHPGSHSVDVMRSLLAGDMPQSICVEEDSHLEK